MEAGSHFSKAKAVLDKLVPTLSGLQKTKIIVDGYTDNVPIGPGLKREGISSNLELSSRRADGVVEYLVQQQSRFFLRQTPFLPTSIHFFESHFPSLPKPFKPILFLYLLGIVWKPDS